VVMNGKQRQIRKKVVVAYMEAVGLSRLDLNNDFRVQIMKFTLCILHKISFLTYRFKVTGKYQL
jgi:hypothetical protein